MLLGFNQGLDGQVNFLFGHIALVGVLVDAHGFHDHGCIHDADGGDVQDRGLALEFGVQQLGPGGDGALDQVGANAQGVGVVDGGDQRHELGRALSEDLALFAFEVNGFLGRRALVADLLAGHGAGGEQAGDLVGVLDALGINALQVAGGHNVLQREILGVDQIEAVGRSDGALGDVVGGDGHVLDFDAGVGLELVGNFLVLVHRRAQVAQHDRFRCVNGREHTRGQNAGRALEHGATLHGKGVKGIDDV